MTRELINIVGTIPVPYKGQNYNIPISIWILDTHPYHAPLCFVKPTSDMQIKVSQHVDNNGQIYLPYLHEWSHPQSDLTSLIQLLILTFSDQPPVYSKPKDQQQQQQQFPSYSYQSPSYSSSSSGYPGGYNPTGAYAFPSHPAPTTLYQQQHNNFYTSPGSNNTPQTEKQQLVSRVEEKIKASLREEIVTKQTTTEELGKVGDRLCDGSNRLNAVLVKLREEIKEVEEVVELTESKIEELKRDEERLDAAGDIDVDEAVVATVPVFKQLLQGK